MKKSKVTVTFYILTLTCTFVLLYLFVLPYTDTNIYFWPLVSLFTLQFVLYFVTLLKDPGYIRKSSKISFLKLNQYFHPSFLCPTCQILRPQDSVHCYICNSCVDRFDHHCPWFDKCIGVGNHNYFFIYLITIWTYLTYVLITCVFNINSNTCDKLSTNILDNDQKKFFFKINGIH